MRHVLVVVAVALALSLALPAAAACTTEPPPGSGCRPHCFAGFDDAYDTYERAYVSANAVACDLVE